MLLVGYEMYRSIALYKVQIKSKNKPGAAKKGRKLTDENGDVLLRKSPFCMCLSVYVSSLASFVEIQFR